MGPYIKFPESLQPKLIDVSEQRVRDATVTNSLSNVQLIVWHTGFTTCLMSLTSVAFFLFTRMCETLWKSTPIPSPLWSVLMCDQISDYFLNVPGWKPPSCSPGTALRKVKTFDHQMKIYILGFSSAGFVHIRNAVVGWAPPSKEQRWRHRYLLPEL